MMEIGAQAYAKWLLVCCVLSAVAMGGLSSTISHPDSHPVVFAFSLSWVIVVVVAAITRNASLRMDPKRFRFARWEREGRVYPSVNRSTT